MPVVTLKHISAGIAEKNDQPKKQVHELLEAFVEALTREIGRLTDRVREAENRSAASAAPEPPPPPAQPLELPLPPVPPKPPEPPRPRGAAELQVAPPPPPPP